MDMAVVVQAGGESTRMGVNKASMPFLGEPLAARVVRRLTPLAGELLVTTNSPNECRYLNAALVEDVYPGKGALGGLYTALAAAHLAVVAVVACDLPFVNPKLLAAQRDLLIESGVDVVVPESKDGLEPLHGVYRREVCLKAVLEALEAGQRRMIAWYPQVRVRIMSVPEVSVFDPEFRSFVNVNTLEEFRRAEALALAAGEQASSGEV